MEFQKSTDESRFYFKYFILYHFPLLCELSNVINVYLLLLLLLLILILLWVHPIKKFSFISVTEICFFIFISSFNGRSKIQGTLLTRRKCRCWSLLLPFIYSQYIQCIVRVCIWMGILFLNANKRSWLSTIAIPSKLSTLLDEFSVTRRT